MAQENFSANFRVLGNGTINPAVPRIVAGFWRRLIACFLDTLVLGFIGFLLSFALFDVFAFLGIWSRFFGFAIALSYFVILNSFIGKGQTIGKRVMKIKVVDTHGELISLKQSFFRYSIFVVLFLLNTLTTYKLSLLTSPMGILSNLVGALIFGGVVLLFLFDTKTRRSLHDLVAGTYVVRCATEYPPLPGGIRKVHLIVLSVWALIAVGLSIFALQTSSFFPSGMTTLSKLTDICQSIENAGKGYRCASIHESVSLGNNQQSKTLQVVVVSSNNIIPTKAEGTSAEIARIIFKEYPEASDNNSIDIALINSVDLWIYSTGRSIGFSHTPAQWKTIMEEQIGDGLKI